MAPRLTDQQLRTLRQRLEDEHNRIVRLLRGAAFAPAPAAEGERSEFEETAQRTAEQGEQLDVAERERALLAEVDRALEKLRAGTYGLDETTGEPIPFDRLAAVPWARGGTDE
jgi:DnaK suppressor protein